MQKKTGIVGKIQVTVYGATAKECEDKLDDLTGKKKPLSSEFHPGHKKEKE